MYGNGGCIRYFAQHRCISVDKSRYVRCCYKPGVGTRPHSSVGKVRSCCQSKINEYIYTINKQPKWTQLSSTITTFPLCGGGSLLASLTETHAASHAMCFYSLLQRACNSSCIRLISDSRRVATFPLLSLWVWCVRWWAASEPASPRLDWGDTSEAVRWWCKMVQYFPSLPPHSFASLCLKASSCFPHLNRT